MHNVTEVDCVILNSGTLRSDTIHPPGKFKMRVHDCTFSYDFSRTDKSIKLTIKIQLYREFV